MYGTITGSGPVHDAKWIVVKQNTTIIGGDTVQLQVYTSLLSHTWSHTGGNNYEFTIHNYAMYNHTLTQLIKFVGTW